MTQPGGIYEDGGFALFEMVKAQRGMSPLEIEVFLATGEKPDTSLPPLEYREDDVDFDTLVLTEQDARALLSGQTVVASSFLDFDSSHGVSPFYETLIRDAEAFKFNPNQPRDEDGRWTDGFPGVNAPDLNVPGGKSGTSTLGTGTKKATPAIIYKKHANGATVAQSKSGLKRMRWDADRKKFIVEQNKNDDWVEEAALTKSAAYNDMKVDQKWFEPNESGQTGTVAEPSSPSLTPEPDLADTEPTAPELPEAPDAVEEPEMANGDDVVPNPAALDTLEPKSNTVAATAEEVWDSLTDRKPGDVIATGKMFGSDARMVVKKKNKTTDGPWIQTQIRSGGGWQEWTNETTKAMFAKEFNNPSRQWKLTDPNAPDEPAPKKMSWPDGWEDGNTLTPEQAAAMHEKLGNWSSESETALYGYTQHSDMLNNAIRQGLSHTSDAEDVAEWSGLIDDAMYELPNDLTVFRHANKNAFGVSSLDELKDLVGKEWNDKAYLSTSVTNFDALPVGDERHPSQIHIKIDLPKGSRGAYIAGVSEYPEQNEFLIARDSTFTISDVEIKDGKAFITMKAHTPAKDETPEIPKQADAPAIEMDDDTPGVYTGPTIEDYAGAPKAVTDKVRAAYLAQVLHDQRVEARGDQLRKENPDKYTGYGAWMDALNDARAELASEAPPDSDLDDALNELQAALPDINVRDNIRRRLHLEASVESKFTEFAKKNGLGALTPAVKADLTQRMRQAFAGKKVAVRMSPKTVEHILNDGRIKSQFETNKSSGKKDFDVRASVERLLFGIYDKPGQNDDKRPIYGYVAVDGIRPAGIGSAQLGDPSTDALSQYGQVQVVLKDSVRDRTTALFGDSMNNMQQAIPTPINNPDWRSFQASYGGITGKGLEGLDRSGENQEFRAGAYAEAQIHGGVSVDDIEEIVFPSNPTAAIKQKLDDAGISWRVLNFKTAANGTDEERENALRIARQDKSFIEGEITKLKEKLADPKYAGDDYYKKDLAKYEKQLKAINDALPALQGEKKSKAKVANATA